MANKTVKIAVTGSAGQIGYALLFRLVSGEVFGSDVMIDLRLLELEAALPALEGVGMELDDCAFPLLQSITKTSNLEKAFEDVDFALLVGSVPRKDGMERKDLIKINAPVFVEQGKALSQYAKPDCKVLVVGNPCNTNAFIAKTVAENIPDVNFFALTMLDQKRGIAHKPLSPCYPNQPDSEQGHNINFLWPFPVWYKNDEGTENIVAPCLAYC